MTRTTECLEALAALVKLTERTAQMLEEAAPDLAEVGYWSRQDKFVLERARAIVAAANARPGRTG